MAYADVAVGAPAQPGKTFSYSIPSDMRVRVGHAVQVPFGPRQLPGFVFAVTELPGYHETRDIARVIDDDPWLSPVQVELALWISETYRAPLFQAASLMIPRGFRQRVLAVYSPLDEPSAAALKRLGDAPREVLDYILGHGKVDQRELERKFGQRNAIAILGQLVRRKLVERAWAWQRPSVRPKLVRHVRLSVTPEVASEELARPAGAAAPKQRELLQAIAEAGDRGVPAPELIRRFGASAGALKALKDRKVVVSVQAPVGEATEPGSGRRPRSVLRLRLAVSQEEAREEHARLGGSLAPSQRTMLAAIAEAGPEGIAVPELGQRVGSPGPAMSALVDQGLVATYEVRVTRDPLADRDYPVTRPLRLTPHQEQAWRRIAESLDDRSGDPHVWLLFGVTGSGKTELYLQALEKVVAQGKRGIVLVPEIALTPQTIQRFSGRFPGRVAVLHSHLSPGEQFDEWWRIREGEFDVVIGPRSAVFAPQPDLGLIVVDEEHEWTYKQQEQQPYYHARDVAIKLGELTGAPVILGSATPSLESFYRARLDRYRLLELPERIIDDASAVEAVVGSLPTIEVVDMREELKSGNRSIFSIALRSGIDSALESREQVILFLNRRGSATFVMCRDCGYVARCRRCDSTLTYHGDEANLQCHQCNHRSRPPRNCPECFGKRIRYLGLGTQRLEVEVAQNFPRANILRWDRDVTKGRDAHEAILKQFQDHEADILIGTQMLAKGLHLPNVTLVGVVNADIGLHLPDFRAAERVFQVLCQVAGRSGRGPAGGRVIIQTYSPDNPAIEAAARQDYVAFYEDEIALRMERSLPPFTRLIRLVYQHTNGLATRRECERVYRLLMERLQTWGFPNTKVVGPAPAPYERLRGRFRWHLVVEGPEPMRMLDELILPQGWTVDVDPVQLL